MEAESFHPEKEEENDLPIICRFYVNLAGGFKYFLFSSLPGEMIQFD